MDIAEATSIVLLTAEEANVYKIEDETNEKWVCSTGEDSKQYQKQAEHRRVYRKVSVRIKLSWLGNILKKMTNTCDHKPYYRCWNEW